MNHRPSGQILIAAMTLAMFVLDALLIFALATLTLVRLDLGRWHTVVAALRQQGDVAIDVIVARAALLMAPLASAFFAAVTVAQRARPWRSYLRDSALLGVATGVVMVTGTWFFFGFSMMSSEPLGWRIVYSVVGAMVGGGTFSVLFSFVVVPAGAIFGLASASCLKLAGRGTPRST